MRKRNWIGLGLALSALIATASAVAATKGVSYSRPVARSDGTPLAAAEIASYTIACTYTPTGGAVAACTGLTPATFAGSSLGGTVTFTATQSGQVCFTLRTVDTGGLSSGPSPTACSLVTLAPPNPPGSVVVAFNVTINGQLVAINPVPVFTLTSSGGRGQTVAGFIPAGTPCIGSALFSYRNQSYRRVPQAAVGFWLMQPNDRIAAPCRPTA